MKKYIIILLFFSCTAKPVTEAVKLDTTEIPEPAPRGLMARASPNSVTWTDLNKVIAVNTQQAADIKKLQDSLTALKKWVNIPETIRADLPLQYYLHSDKKVHIKINP